MEDRYPRALYHSVTLESRLVETREEYQQLIRSRQWVGSPKDLGIETCPQRHISPVDSPLEWLKARCWPCGYSPRPSPAFWQAVAAARAQGVYGQLFYGLRNHIETMERRQGVVHA